MGAAFDTDLQVHGRGVAATVAGVIEAVLGHDARAEHLLEAGQAEAEADKEESVRLFLWACRFVGTALRRPQSPAAQGLPRDRPKSWTGHNDVS